MAIIPFPAGVKPAAADYSVEFSPQITVARNGRVQTYGMPGARWNCAIRFENDNERGVRPLIEAFLLNLEGGANRAQFGHLGRPRPNGTLRGTPTLASAAAAGATTITLANANGGVKAGDVLGIPGQLLMAVADATPVLTNLTVSVKPAVRVTTNSGTTVTWDSPKTLWIPKTAVAGPFPYEAGKFRPAFTVEFIEVW